MEVTFLQIGGKILEIVINGVNIVCNEKITVDELQKYLELEQKRFPYRKIDKLVIEISGEDVFLKPVFNSVIRLRRITGYLSNINNFNNAKQEEAHDRVKHIKS